MNFSKYYDDPRGSKVPKYESSIENPISMQGTQPLAFNAHEFTKKEVPIYYQNEEEVKITIGSCLQILLVQLIPVVGIVMLCIWSVSKDHNYVRRILSRALLVFGAILCTAATLAYLAAIRIG